MDRPSDSTPLVYSCSGCSSAARTANAIARALDRRGVAELSYIAGDSGDVPSLIRTDTFRRPVVALDGCPVACARWCLARHGVVPDLHIDLNDHGVTERRRIDPRDTDRITDELEGQIRQRWPNPD